MAKSNELSIDDKKCIIEHFDNIDAIPLVCLPDSVNSDKEESYYFVSYSSRDYKEVYKDLLDFQKLGSIEIDGKEIPLRFFYDRGYAINSGENWETIAKDFIAPQPCKGVIFYISENSLRSEAIANEIAFAKEHLKQVITVILPFPRDFLYKGKNQKGNDKLTAVEYLDILIEEEQDKKELAKLENARKIMSGFITSNTTYISYSKNISSKAKSIANNLTGLPLLNIVWFGVQGINNILAREINESDFSYYDKTEQIVTAKRIDSCAFANCTKLKNIELPADIGTIGSYAFYNCRSLKSISIPNSVKYIGENAFRSCENLEMIRLPKRIEKIERETFFGCSSLKHIVIPQSVVYIRSDAFCFCGNLRDIHFLGTKAEWKNIKKDVRWIYMDNYDTFRYYTVHCVDGNIKETFFQ